MLKYITISLLALNIACIADETATPIQQPALLKAPCIEALESAELYKACTEFLEHSYTQWFAAIQNQATCRKKVADLTEKAERALSGLESVLTSRPGYWWEIEPQFSQAPRPLVEKALAFRSDHREQEVGNAFKQEILTCDLSTITNDALKSYIETIRLSDKEIPQATKEEKDADTHYWSIHRNGEKQLMELSYALSRKSALSDATLTDQQAKVLRVEAKKAYKACGKTHGLCSNEVAEYLEIMKAVKKFD